MWNPTAASAISILTRWSSGLRPKLSCTLEQQRYLLPRDPATGVVLPKVYAGRGYTTTPNLHTGKEEGSTAFVQTSTGAIIDIEQINPGITRSGKVSWREGFTSAPTETSYPTY